MNAPETVLPQGQPCSYIIYIQPRLIIQFENMLNYFRLSSVEA
jgi:hypothetical protein